MERGRLEVILEAQNRAGRTLRQFGGQVRRAMADVHRHASRARRALADVGRGFSGLGAMAGRAGAAIRMIGGPILWFIGLLARLASAAASALASVVGWVTRAGVAAARWIGRTAVGAVRRMIYFLGLLSAAATAGGIALTWAFVKAAGQMERYRAQMEVLTGSARAAQERLTELVRFAAETPFDLPGIIEADKLVLAFGLDLGGVAETLRLFGDAAAAMGVPIDQVIRNFAKLKAGMFDMAEMAPLGITRDRLRELGVEFTKAGEVVNRDDLFPAAIRLIERFAGTMEKVSATTEGRLSNLGDAWFNFKERVGSAVEVLTKTIIGRMTTALDRIEGDAKALMAALGTSLGPTLVRIVDGAINIFEKLVRAMRRVAENDRWRRFVAIVSSVLALAQQKISDWIDWLAENWDSIWDRVGARVATAANWIALQMGHIVGSLRYLYDNRGLIWDWAREVMAAARAAGQAIAHEVIDRVRGMAEKFGYQQLGPEWLDVQWSPAAAKLQLATTVAGAGAGSRFGPLGTAVGTIMGWNIGGKMGQDLAQLPEMLDKAEQDMQDWGQSALEYFDQQRGMWEQGQGFWGELNRAATATSTEYRQALHEWLAQFARQPEGPVRAIAGMQQLAKPELLGYTEAGEEIWSAAVWAFGDSTERLTTAAHDMQDASRRLDDGGEALAASSRDIASAADGLRAVQAAETAPTAWADFPEPPPAEIVQAPWPQAIDVPMPPAGIETPAPLDPDRQARLAQFLQDQAARSPGAALPTWLSGGDYEVAPWSYTPPAPPAELVEAATTAAAAPQYTAAEQVEWSEGLARYAEAQDRNTDALHHLADALYYQQGVFAEAGEHFASAQTQESLNALIEASEKRDELYRGVGEHFGLAEGQPYPQFAGYPEQQRDPSGGNNFVTFQFDTVNSLADLRRLVEEAWREHIGLEDVYNNY